MSAFVVSFVVVFVAELGDKSQLMAMSFATRYRFWTVLWAITAATAVVHLASVAVGALLSQNLPTNAISIAAGIAFVFFGLWTLRGDELSEEEEGKSRAVLTSAFWGIAIAFFLAELGDKTMLATITVAANEHWFGTWIGSTVGMVAADALAIGLGVVLGKALPERVVKIGAATLFFLFGGFMIVSGIVKLIG